MAQLIRKNDTVVLLKDFTGPQPNRKGSTARVLKVFPKQRRAILEGVNVKHKHIRAQTNRDYPRGGIIRKEAPVDLSNVALYCAKCEKKASPAWKDVDKKRTRVCERCGEKIETSA
jgi:large subunit ribosomal protein L24